MTFLRTRTAAALLTTGSLAALGGRRLACPQGDAADDAPAIALGARRPDRKRAPPASGGARLGSVYRKSKNPMTDCNFPSTMTAKSTPPDIGVPSACVCVKCHL